jgi:hypothetical protein
MNDGVMEWWKPLYYKSNTRLFTVRPCDIQRCFQMP